MMIMPMNKYERFRVLFLLKSDSTEELYSYLFNALHIWSENYEDINSAINLLLYLEEFTWLENYTHINSLMSILNYIPKGKMFSVYGLKIEALCFFFYKKKSRSFSEYWLLIYCQNTRKFIYLFCNATFGIQNNHINK